MNRSHGGRPHESTDAADLDYASVRRIHFVSAFKPPPAPPLYGDRAVIRLIVRGVQALIVVPSGVGAMWVLWKLIVHG